MFDRMRGGWSKVLALAGLLLLAAASAALAGMGQPSPGQMVLQDAATPVARDIRAVYDLVNYIIIAITVFVLMLMVYVMVRYSERANPTPSRVTHNTTIEVLWTVIPILILVVIAIPSFKLLRLQYAYPKPDLTIKATGYQWYWGHEYPDQGGIKVDSVMLQDNEREALIKRGIPAPRLLAVDNEVVVPVNKVVHVLVTANDVIHTIVTTNTGTVATDANSIFTIDSLPAQVQLYVGDFDGTGPATGTILFTRQNGTTLSLTAASDVRFSNLTPVPTSFAACTYVPISIGDLSL
mgnify:CR=1 FL=1